MVVIKHPINQAERKKFHETRTVDSDQSAIGKVSVVDISKSCYQGCHLRADYYHSQPYEFSRLKGTGIGNDNTRWLPPYLLKCRILV